MSDKTEKSLAAIAAELQPEAPAAEDPAEPTPEAEAPAITREELEELELPGDSPEPVERPPFRIADDGCADWAIRKIAEERRERDRLVTLARDRIAEFQAQIDRAEKRYQQNTDFLTGHLGGYFQTVPHKKTPTTEKYRLLSGTLTLKLGKLTPKPDDEKLAPWLKQNGHADLVKVEEKAKWGELKKMLTLNGSVACLAETGEIVDGITVEQAPDIFTVDL